MDFLYLLFLFPDGDLWTNKGFFCLSVLYPAYISIYKVTAFFFPSFTGAAFNGVLPLISAGCNGGNSKLETLKSFWYWWMSTLMTCSWPDREPPGGSIVVPTLTSDLFPSGINNQTLWNEERSKVECQVPLWGRHSQRKHYIRHAEIFTSLCRLLSLQPSSGSRALPSGVAPAVC